MLKQIFSKNNGEQQNKTEMRWAEGDNKPKKFDLRVVFVFSVSYRLIEWQVGNNYSKH